MYGIRIAQHEPDSSHKFSANISEEVSGAKQKWGRRSPSANEKVARRTALCTIPMQDMNVMCDLEGPSDLLLFNAATETLIVIGKTDKEREQGRSSAPAKGGRGAGVMAR